MASAQVGLAGVGFYLPPPSSLLSQILSTLPLFLSSFLSSETNAPTSRAFRSKINGSSHFHSSFVASVVEFLPFA